MGTDFPNVSRSMAVEGSLADKVLEEVKSLYPNALLCKIDDISGPGGCGAKLELTVVSDTFQKVPLIKRHREIQNHLQNQGFFNDIHALIIKAWTVEQWEKKKGSSYS